MWCLHPPTGGSTLLGVIPAFYGGHGAPGLLVELYGDVGRHARSAVGIGGLPRGGCVEVETVVEIAD